MKSEQMVYLVYVVFFLLLVGTVFMVPILAFHQDMDWAYNAYGYTCHQKISRSICIFNNTNGFQLGDCTPQIGNFIDSKIDKTTTGIGNQSEFGYKIPVCARDVGIYGSMLLGAIAYPFVRKLEDRKVYPAIFLVLAIVPLGIDGSVQLLSELGFLPFIYESTNMIRLATGFVAGFASSFYAIPILMNMFGGREHQTKEVWNLGSRNKQKTKKSR